MVTTAHHNAEGKLPNCCGCASRSSTWIAADAMKTTIRNNRNTLANGPASLAKIRRNCRKPAISGTDEGIWRRLRLVPFTVSIPKDEQDRDLLKKLDTELPGILQWAIRGCLTWQRQGLDPPALITDAVRAYRDESDVLGRFIAEHCEVSNLAQVKSGVFFQRYQAYAEQSSEDRKSVV